MGVYLSTPITEKESEDGEHGLLKYGASAMQGWRRGMEDAHLALGQLPGLEKVNGDQEISMFAVFDGHGGAEVAKFCAHHMPHEIQQLPEFQDGDYQNALTKVFHRIDEILETGEHRDELKEYRAMGEQAGNAQNGTEGAEEDDDDKPAGALSAQEALEIFQKLLAISNGDRPPPGAAQDNDDEDDEDDEDENVGKTADTAIAAAASGDPEESGAQALPPTDTEENFPALSASNTTPPPTQRVNDDSTDADSDNPILLPPTQDGPRFQPQTNQVCSLADHPLAAGCTSVVCLLVGSTLYVANAGDSRAVICRDGKAIPLSNDHKPAQEIETQRIHKAGGFITQAGRVNGNLNLSRSIGDLKYKQNKALPPKDQIITAEPDITRTELHPNDEFLLIGCDGIWDCKTNEEAVEFVKERLGQGMQISKICEELMDDCLADDPRKSTGIGGDNMTCVIVQLQHKAR
mmetsp:Transcript_1046/g.1359  ORF Transcript_1046/g.1359 Transcript_1046/m.1359 type:complete len:462 (-) Transcript_1046:297-1682(-)|eukprot:CAMPEP_0117757584 /NCGR_PEP_ID=MMETSP0947-20121206/14827_1 /TAXON_ID=44440 /ORGANISM="Chattonella subsalsa, Strain CCMP2191" /LENGTH=461 /DNA_ID=CAMNT_0005577523 /DNA_START=242 /DNA_END=1627 /DNA_ORIENTATION=-